MRFADIPGHEEVKERLRRMAEDDRIPGALLLEGLEGAGKFALARAFAQYVHCENRTPDGDSCGKCPSCVRHQTFNSLETFFSFPVIKINGKETVSEDWAKEFREFINEYPYMGFEHWLESLDNPNTQPQMYGQESIELVRRLGFKARADRYKMVLMWLPERMNETASNRLLKMVEEPFADTRFVMVSNNSRRIIPTIYSRTQRIQVSAFSDEEVIGILIDKGIDEETAVQVAHISEGNVNLAFRLAGMDEQRRQFLALFMDLMRKAYARKVAGLRAWTKDVAELGREAEMRFIDYCCRMFRESFLMHLESEDVLTMTADERTFLNRFYPFINEKNVIELIELFDRTRRDIGANGNPKIVLFDLALRVIMLIRRK